MSTCCRDLEGAPGDDLPPHVGEIWASIFATIIGWGCVDMRPRPFISERPHQICEISTPANETLPGE